MIITKSRLYLLFSFLLLCGCRAKTEDAGGKSMQIKGSDTIVNLVQAWAEEFTKRNPSVNIAVTGGGSGTGIAALINGTCDIAMSSRPMDEKEKDKAKAGGINPVEFTVGLDGLAVVVNNNNEVSGLTMEQLRDVFMSNTKNWEDFGWKGGKIVILSRESNSGTHVFFKEHVLKRGNKKSPEEFSPDALLMPSSQAIVDEVSQNPHAIGYVGMGYVFQSLKAVAVAKDKNSKYVSPTVANVMSNSYPISRPLFLYTDGKPSSDVKKFIDFAISKEGQEIVKNVDFVPIISPGKK